MSKSANEAIYKKKAAENFAAAKLLAKTHPNASASRGYYSAFLGSVAEYERLGIEPQSIDAGAAQSFKDISVKWTHGFIRNHARMLGLDGRQCDALKWAYKMRVKADYEVDEISAAELESLLKKVQDILECFGVIVGG